MANHQHHSHKDVRVPTGYGSLFARIWIPAGGSTIYQSPIVLFHDSLGCVQLWRNFPALLSKCTGRTVIAYDRLGFGRSDARGDKLATNFILAEAEHYFPALREYLGFDRFVAFGHSVGGGMAVHCAARFGASCEALITESAQAFVEEKTRQGIIEAKALLSQPEHLKRLEKYHGDKVQWVLGSWIDTWLSPDFACWSLESVLPQICCPVLAIHGDEDEYGSTQHPELITRLVRGPSRLKLLPNTRHSPHREQEQFIARLVADFLSMQGLKEAV